MRETIRFSRKDAKSQRDIDTRFHDIIVFGKIVAMKKIFLTAIISATVLCNWAVAQTATPAPLPAPVTVQKPVQTLADLQSKIRSRLLSPDLRRGQVGVKIVSLNSGQVIFEQNSEKYFMPASNMKNFTVATALEKLGPDFRYVTSVRAASQPDADGVIHGPLVIVGRGDVSASTSFDPAFRSGPDNLVGHP